MCTTWPESIHSHAPGPGVEPVASAKPYTRCSTIHLAVYARTREFHTLYVMVCRCLHGLFTEYLSEDFRLVSEIHCRQRLRSASSTDVVVLATRRSSLGDRAFPVAGARVWNALPPSVTSAPSLSLSLSLYFGDFWKFFCFSDNCVYNYCIVVLKCLCTQHHVNPGVCELSWTAASDRVCTSVLIVSRPSCPTTIVLQLPVTCSLTLPGILSVVYR